MAKANTPSEIVIPPLRETAISVVIENIDDSPLVIHNFDQKLLINKPGPKSKRTPRDPEEKFQKARYVDEVEGWDGFPAIGFKAAMVGACRYVNMTMTEAKGLFFVMPDGIDKSSRKAIVKVEGDGPHLREDYVRLQTGVADLAYRPEFRKWKTNLRIRFNPDLISDQSIVNLLNFAGHYVGVGEGRPQSRKSCGQDWGRFRVVTHALKEDNE